MSTVSTSSCRKTIKLVQMSTVFILLKKNNKSCTNAYKCLQTLSPLEENTIQLVHMPTVSSSSCRKTITSVQMPMYSIFLLKKNNTISTYAYSLFLLLKKNNTISTHANRLFLLKKAMQLVHMPTVSFSS